MTSERLAGDRVNEQSLTDSKDDVIFVCETDAGGQVVLLGGARLAIYDDRRRRIATINDIGALFSAFDGLEI